MVKANRYILAQYFKGEPKKSDFKIVEEDLPPLQKNEFLVKAECWSVDPYMKSYMNKYPLGTTMIGYQIARIVDSKNKNFPVGKLVYSHYGWRDYTIDGGKHFEKKSLLLTKTYLLPDLEDLPTTVGLGALGMPGNTAYFGLLEICYPQPGEIVVVSGAAGAVGSLVGQIAKIQGCKVIGFAGSDTKCKWLKEELGFDYAFNYKTVDAAEALKKAAPEGTDIYFDNVGGELSSIIINQMKIFGRISVCGSFPAYQEDESNNPTAPILQPSFVFKQLKMTGFVVRRWASRWNEGIQQNLKWIKEGKLKYKDTATVGFQNMPDAFIGMLRGETTGKAVVKVAEN